MQIRISRSIVVFVMVVGLTALAVACASNKAGRARKEEQTEHISVVELTAPARAAVEKLTTGGKVEKIDKEVEKGRTVYDVEATVNGKHVEYVIATDGEIVGTETSVEFNELPEVIRDAAGKYFGGTAGLGAAKGVEDGRTTYEIEGKRDGKKVAATFDETGKLVEEEK